MRRRGATGRPRRPRDDPDVGDGLRPGGAAFAADRFGVPRASYGRLREACQTDVDPQNGDNHILLAPLAFNLLMGRSWPPGHDPRRRAPPRPHARRDLAGVGSQPSARTPAVTTTATTTVTSTFAPRHRATPAAATPAVCGPTRDRPPLGPCRHDDQRRQQRRRHQPDDAGRPRRQLAPADRHRPEALDERRSRRETPSTTSHSVAAHGEPSRWRRSPANAARLAASTGIPAGVNGTSASAISPPAQQPPPARAGGALRGGYRAALVPFTPAGIPAGGEPRGVGGAAPPARGLAVSTTLWLVVLGSRS